jgi:hypothetical protein
MFLQPRVPLLRLKRWTAVGGNGQLRCEAGGSTYDRDAMVSVEHEMEKDLWSMLAVFVTGFSALWLGARARGVAIENEILVVG